MCTATTYKTINTYFGRNLDLDYNHDESITITPRNFPLQFRDSHFLKSHYALLGVAFVTPDADGHAYPLYYDAINEHGLGIAGLMFAGNAKYFPALADHDNIAPFEFIPWVLGQCASVAEARQLISRMNFYADNFSTALPLVDLHWLISDPKESITVESTAAGLQVYDNPVGVLTNNPPFPAQLFQLNNYMCLSPADPLNTFDADLQLNHYSRGLGTRFLPGGLDSQSRFVRTVFTKHNSISEPTELASVSQFFHILHSCDQPRGCDLVHGESEITVYSSCYNLQRGLVYYTCYDNHQITCVDLHKTKLDGKKLKSYPLLTTEHINYQNS